MKMHEKSFFLSLVLLASLAGAVQAATWHVDVKGVPGAGGTGPADALPSLQEAVDRARDGDLILVAEGTYAPVSVASSRSLAIRSTGGAQRTVLAGDGKSRCATFADEKGGAAQLVTLEGFTLAGGVDASDAGGGGVFGGNLVNCVLRDNAAVKGGGASGARLENCLLTGNAAAVAGGGAVDSDLVNCTVAGNRADGTGGGASGCKIVNSIVQANDSPDGADAVASLAVHSCTTPLLPGEGNSAADACFADAEAGDWRLAKGSPCLDAGDGGFCTSATDLAGNRRVEGDAVDLGAYEGAAKNAARSKGVSRKAAGTVTITFDPNGGTCAVTQMKFRVGTNYAGFPKPVRPGHVCIGWFTAADGGTRINGNTVASASHRKFFAHWAPTVDITFDPNGGTCAVRKMTFRVGVKYAGFPKPVLPGYVCTGWFTAADGGNRINGNTVASASHRKFYAHWARAVPITFDPNGGTCAVKQKIFHVGQKYSGFPKPVLPGYVCTGWFTAATGGTRINGKTAVSTSHKTFYAHWARAVPITFNPNGGTCSVKKKIFHVGQKYSGFPKPVRRGCICIGWFTAAKGGTRINGKTAVSTSHETFYAHWARAVVVTFDPNGGTCPVSKKKYGLGRLFGSLPVPTKEGHVFAGWYTPEGERVAKNSKVTVSRTKLIAHWNQNLSVHPVGDSMTYGVRTRTNPLYDGNPASVVAKISNQGWRGYLNQSLSLWGADKDLTIHFLGMHPESSYAGNVPHDGYGGVSASEYADRHQDAVAVVADIQIVFLGMNDALSISRKDDHPSNYWGYSKEGYAKVLSSLDAGSSTPMTILITEPKVTSLIKEHNRIYNPSAINRVISDYVNPYVRSQAGSKVILLDIESFYSNGGYTDDGFHLSVEGNQVLASRLAELIEAFWK